MGKQYELYVQKGQPFWKVLTNILFSHVGLLVLVIGYCVAGEKPGTYNLHISPSTTHNDSPFQGALAFQYIEQQREEDNHAAKIAATEVSL